MKTLSAVMKNNAVLSLVSTERYMSVFSRHKFRLNKGYVAKTEHIIFKEILMSRSNRLCA